MFDGQKNFRHILGLIALSSTLKRYRGVLEEDVSVSFLGGINYSP
jgi:hypothetical protein